MKTSDSEAPNTDYVSSYTTDTAVRKGRSDLAPKAVAIDARKV